MIDRYSSSTLDRPFAIADRDIAVGLPAHVNDGVLTATNTLHSDLGSFADSYAESGPNEMTVFLACVHLRKITSRIHRFPLEVKNHSKPPVDQSFLATGKVLCGLDELLGALEKWYASTPIFTSPKCLYESREYFEFLHWRERLQLVRRAMDVVPKRQGVPPQALLSLCLNTATRGIELFSDMFERNVITCTRSYFSFIFTAGLSVIFSISVSEDRRDCTDGDRSSRALIMCDKTLRNMGEELPDAKQYVAVFEALRKIAWKSGRNTPSRPLQSTASFMHEAQRNGPLLEQQVQNEMIQQSHSHGQIQAEEPPPEGGWGAFNINTEVSYPRFGENDPTSNTLYETDVGVGPAIFPPETVSPDADAVLPWAFLSDSTLWTVEAGLGQYVYGDPSFNVPFFH